MRRLRLRVIMCSLFLVLCAGAVLAAGQSSAPAAGPATPIKSTKSADSEARGERLEGVPFWLGLVSAVSLILPLPICLYHFRRMRAMLAVIDDLKQKQTDQEA